MFLPSVGKDKVLALFFPKKEKVEEGEEGDAVGIGELLGEGEGFLVEGLKGGFGKVEGAHFGEEGAGFGERTVEEDLAFGGAGTADSPE